MIGGVAVGRQSWRREGVIVGLAPGPIERVSADVVVVPLFASERPLRDAAGRVDWRLCGRLSHLFAAGRLLGAADEAVLIPGGGGVRAPRVLGLGLGERGALDAPRWERWVTAALGRSRALVAQHAVLALPESGDALADRLTALAGCAARDPGPAEISLAPEPADVAGVVEWLRRAARRAPAPELEIRAPAELRTPQGGDPAEPGAVSSRTPAGRSTR